MPDPPPPSPSRRDRLQAWMERAAGAEGAFLRRRPGPGPAGRGIRALQVLVLSMRRYREDHAGDRAAALAFATLLSMLPLLLLALAAFGAAGTDPQRMVSVRDWLMQNFVPDTARGLQATLEASLDALRAASEGLGLVGLAFLVVTAWKLLATLERTFRQVWGSPGAGSRLRRILGFWVTVLLSPFLVTASVFLTGTLEALAGSEILTVRTVFERVSYLVPLLPGWIGLAAAYGFLPGVRTPFRAAALGATAAALLWEALKVGFAAYIRHAFVARTILAGMGVLPIFLLWLYLSWAVFVFGAELAYVAHDYDAALLRCGLEPEPGEKVRSEVDRAG